MKDLQNSNDEMSIQMCDENRIQCKTCKWARLAGPTCGSCAEYKNKPADVYFEGQPCPKFKEYIKNANVK